MANSADPDQLASSTDLDLHCLQRQGISGFSRTRVKVITNKTIVQYFVFVTKISKFINEMQNIFMTVYESIACLGDLFHRLQ